MPIVMIVVGVLAGIAGLIVMHVAAGRKERAELGANFSKALSGGAYTNTAPLDAAVSMGHWGLGFLIAGAAVVLAGVVVVAIRRP